MTRYLVALNGQTGEYEVHAATCPDPARKAPGTVRKVRGKNYAKLGEYTHPAWPVEAESGEAALAAELNSDFSGRGEHPARDGYPEGSYGAAGFTGRVFPCAEKGGGA